MEKPFFTVLPSQSLAILPINEEVERNFCTEHGSDIPSKLPLSSQWLATWNVWAFAFLKIWSRLELLWSGNICPFLQSRGSYSLPFHHNLEQQYRFHGLQQRCRLLHLETQLCDPSEVS